MYSFRLENYEKWLDGFAKLVNGSVKDHVLTLPSHIGDGTIMADTVNEHLSYAIMDIKLATDLELTREPALEGEIGGFSLAFNQVEMQKEVQLASGQAIIAEKRPGRNDIFLSDSRDRSQFRFPAGSHVKRLLVFATHELAARYLPQELFTKLESFARENSFSGHPMVISLPHRTMLKELFDIRENDPVNKLKRFSHVMYLVERFLHTYLRQEQAMLPRTVKKNDMESMLHIEQILSSRLEGFPSLEFLAQEVFMSTSKLKNLFKQIYGFTLYDYYNKSRLQRAKDLLVTGQCSIKQAGSEIGFSNLSHFAKAFRKEFGILPRDIVRTR
jgi:AraC-like DNA-binding protein